MMAHHFKIQHPNIHVLTIYIQQKLFLPYFHHSLRNKRDRGWGWGMGRYWLKGTNFISYKINKFWGSNVIS